MPPRISKIKNQRSNINLKQRIIFIVGPTAVGKSAVAAALARKINAEIISCDSMQVYKGMDIITSKPGAALRRAVKHHLIGVVGAGEDYNVSAYRREALRKVKEIIARGRTPLFAGGTGLYMAILADGIFEGGVKSGVIRNKLYKIAAVKGSPYLHARLKKVDPAAAEKIHPNDAKRIIRALEVFKATGKPISVLQKERHGLRDDCDVRIFCLDMERDKLYKRIDQRVEKMFKLGLVNEVSGLLKKRLGMTASLAIGIKEIKGYIRGEYGLAEAKARVKLNTRRYAKRQLTWFRKDKTIKWIKVKEKESPRETAKRIWQKELY